MATTRSKIYEAICEALLHSQGAAYTPTTPYTGGLPNKTVKKGSKGTDVKHVQNFLNWCIKAGLKVDGVCGSKTVSAIKAFQRQYGLKQDGAFGPKCKAKAQAIVNAHKPTPVPTPSTNAQKIVARAKEYAWPYGTAASKYSYKKGSAKSVYKTALKKYMGKSAKISQTDCGYFVTTCVRASGVSSSFLALKGVKEKFPSVPNTMKIVHSGKKIPDGLLQAGDIIRYKKTSGQHTLMYYGDGKIAEAGREGQFPAIEKDTKKYNKSNVKFSTLQVIRAK